MNLDEPLDEIRRSDPRFAGMIDDTLRLAQISYDSLRENQAREAERGPAEMIPVQGDYVGESGLKNIMDALTEAGIIPGAKEQHEPPRRSRPKAEKASRVKPSRSVELMPSAARESVGGRDDEGLSDLQPHPVRNVSFGDEALRQMRELIGQFLTILGARKAPGEEGSVPPEWSGPAWEALEPLPRRLLMHMNGRERADVRDLETAVWGKDAVSEAALYGAINKANEFLNKIASRQMLGKVRREAVVRWQ
jgi:hypothetical protein